MGFLYFVYGIQRLFKFLRALEIQNSSKISISDKILNKSVYAPTLSILFKSLFIGTITVAFLEVLDNFLESSNKGHLYTITPLLLTILMMISSLGDGSCTVLLDQSKIKKIILDQLSSLMDLKEEAVIRAGNLSWTQRQWSYVKSNGNRHKVFYLFEVSSDLEGYIMPMPKIKRSWARPKYFFISKEDLEILRKENT